MALITASIINQHLYFTLNAPPAQTGGTAASAAKYVNGLGLSGAPATADQLNQAAASVGEKSIVSRTGGAPTLAFGMSEVLQKVFGGAGLKAFWYHFAIMFEALFILTTIDTGTRIGRFLLQELIGRVHAPMGQPRNLGGGVLATTAVVVGWAYFILTGNIATLWPMFGVANQLLACAALAIGTTILLREAKRRVYALVTLLPLMFVATTTISAAVMSILVIYLPMTHNPATRYTGWVDTGVTTGLLACIVMIILGSVARWVRTLRATPPYDQGQPEQQAA
jgi:carbon starvation protein